MDLFVLLAASFMTGLGLAAVLFILIHAIMDLVTSRGNQR